MLNNKQKWSMGLGLLVGVFGFWAGQASANPNANVEPVVKASFPDMPGMAEIAKCESGFRQFNADGSALRGGAGRNYIGIFQIDERLHRQRALDMAYDINTVEGNIAYARFMYFRSGTNPWKACLPNVTPTPVLPQPLLTPAPVASPVPSPTPAAPATFGLTMTLKAGMNHSQVLNLQQILNQKGFTVAPSGPGSLGQETSYFGSLAREAVKRFQCEKNIACSGDESSTGYGLVGPRTRAALSQ